MLAIWGNGVRIEGAMSEETKWVRNPAYYALGPENDVYVDPRFTRKGPATRAAEHTLQNMKNEPLPKEWEEFGEIPIGKPIWRVNDWSVALEYYKACEEMNAQAHAFSQSIQMSFTHWSYNIRGTSTDTRPTNITEGAD